jgi:hypothetical protein
MVGEDAACQLQKLGGVGCQVLQQAISFLACQNVSHQGMIQPQTRINSTTSRIQHMWSTSSLQNFPTPTCYKVRAQQHVHLTQTMHTCRALYLSATPPQVLQDTHWVKHDNNYIQNTLKPGMLTVNTPMNKIYIMYNTEAQHAQTATNTMRGAS